MNIVFKPFGELSAKQIEDLFRLRQQVFIIEQDCFYEDIDGGDDKAHHLLFYEDKQIAGYLRIFYPESKLLNECRIGRIVVHSSYRGTGLGSELIKKGIELCDRRPIRIEAQAALKNYYNQLGFQEEGEVYAVDGIDHLQMLLT